MDAGLSHADLARSLCYVVLLLILQRVFFHGCFHPHAGPQCEIAGRTTLQFAFFLLASVATSFESSSQWETEHAELLARTLVEVLIHSVSPCEDSMSFLLLFRNRFVCTFFLRSRLSVFRVAKDIGTATLRFVHGRINALNAFRVAR